MATLALTSPVADTYISTNAQTTNYNSATVLAAYVSATFDRRPILQFDASAIPSNAMVSSAVLSMVCNTSANGPLAAEVHPLSTTDVVFSQMTWLLRKTGTAWTTAGGDYVAGTSDAITLPASTGTHNFTITNTVQYCITNHSGNVLALFYLGALGNPGVQNLYDSIETVAGTDPSLTITYTVPSNNGGGRKMVGRLRRSKWGLK